MDEGLARCWKPNGGQMGGTRAEQMVGEAMEEMMGSTMEELMVGEAMEEMTVERSMEE